jgi:hypothetical protein
MTVLGLVLSSTAALAQSILLQDSSLHGTARDTIPSIPRLTKSPALAMGLSAMLPGAGQVYNRSYWKVPIIAGFGIYFGYEFFQNHRQYKDYRDQYSASLQVLSTGDSRLLALREFYKEQRDTFGWYFLILYLVNVADAYVDASLFDFDVGDALAIRVVPEASSLPAPGPRLALRLCF